MDEPRCFLCRGELPGGMGNQIVREVRDPDGRPLRVHEACADHLFRFMLHETSETWQKFCRLCGRPLVWDNGTRAANFSTPIYRAPVCDDCRGQFVDLSLELLGLPSREELAKAPRICGTCMHQRLLPDAGVQYTKAASAAVGWQKCPAKKCCRGPGSPGLADAPDDWGCDIGWQPRPVVKSETNKCAAHKCETYKEDR